MRWRIVVRGLIVFSLLLQRSLLLERPGPREAHVRPIILAPAKLSLFALTILLALAAANLEERTLIVIVVRIALSFPRIGERILLLDEAFDGLLLDDRVMVPLTANEKRVGVSLRLIGLDTSLPRDLVARLDLKRMRMLLAYKVRLIVGRFLEVLVIVGRVFPLLDDPHRLLLLASKPHKGLPLSLEAAAASH